MAACRSSRWKSRAPLIAAGAILGTSVLVSGSRAASTKAEAPGGFLPLPLVANPRDDFDQQNFRRLQASGADQLLLEGENLFSQGSYGQALETFQQALALVPENSLLHRRRCETLAASGRRSEALDACRQAIRVEMIAPNMRALTGALMTGSGVPSMGDVSEAQYWADSATQQKMHRHWGYAAQCDIAFRIGDASVQRSCLQKLRELAPSHQETKRAQSMILTPSYPLRLPHWLAIGAVCLATLAHALVRKVSLVRRALSAAAAAALLAQSWVVPAYAQADLGEKLSELPIDDENPEGSVPSAEKRNAEPLQFGYWLMDVADRGEAALSAKDFERAARFYRALAKAVPDRATAFSKLCQIYQELKQPDQAIEACSVALGLEGTDAADAYRYIRLMLDKPQLTALERKDLEDVFAHLESQGVGASASFETAELFCEASAKRVDAKGLRQCLPTVQKHASGAARTLSFQFALALAESEYDKAEGLIEATKKAGMAPPGVEAMRKALAIAQGRHKNLWGILGAAGVGLILGLVFFWRSRAAKKKASLPVEPTAKAGSVDVAATQAS